MMASSLYTDPEPDRDEVDATRGPLVLEFGTPWCGFCRAARPHIVAAFAGHESTRHLMVEDGPDRPLGRSFRVKRWPTLVFLRNGVEVSRVVRPADEHEMRAALARIESD
jgi:thioredoxin 1